MSCFLTVEIGDVRNQVLWLDMRKILSILVNVLCRLWEDGVLHKRSRGSLPRGHGLETNDQFELKPREAITHEISVFKFRTHPEWKISSKSKEWTFSHQLYEVLLRVFVFCWEIYSFYAQKACSFKRWRSPIFICLRGCLSLSFEFFRRVVNWWF